MSEQSRNESQCAVETRSRELFRESVDALDMQMRSRLTQARYAALDGAAAARRRPWFLRFARVWTPAAGLTAAVLLGAGLWLGSPAGIHGLAGDNAPAWRISTSSRRAMTGRTTPWKCCRTISIFMILQIRLQIQGHRPELTFV